MKKEALQIAALAVVLLLVCALCRLAMDGAYVAYFPVSASAGAPAPERIHFRAESPDVVAWGAPEVVNGYIRVRVHPQRPGETFVSVDEDALGSLGLRHFRVGRFHTVYDSSTGGFTGDSVALAAFTVFCFAVAAIMLRFYLRAKGPAFYGYATIYSAGFSLFALLTGLLMLYVSLRHGMRPRDFSMRSAYGAISGASFSFVMATAPFMLAFAAAMAVSNVALLRHERFRPQNVLGIGVSLALVVGEIVAFRLYTRDFSGSERQYRVIATLQNVYATAFAYFECMLIGAIVCGVRAARYVPAADKDYILILGCRFRADGSLPPLLRGRVDRAIDFWRGERAASGRMAVLIPSGGQGPDESMPEAEAMRRYLLARGVPEEAIRVEDRSRNTFENMAFSKALIEAEKPGARVAYVTTNYHEFRSGVWAALAGLPAEGVGSRTKWWFWPNAFMRECAGLLKNRLPQELMLLAVWIAFFGALSMTLH